MKKRKAILLLSGILVVVIAIIVIIVATKAKAPNPINGEISFYVTGEGALEDYYVYNSKEHKYRPIEISANKKTTLSILNGKEDVDSIYVLITNQEGEILAQEEFLNDGKTDTMTFEQEVACLYDISFVLIGADGMEFYVSNENCFLDITSDPRVKNQSVTLLRDLCIEGDADDTITFPYPYIWNLGTYSFLTNRAIHFSGQEVGTMYIHNWNVELTENNMVLFDAPNMDLVWTGACAPTFTYIEQYMNVKSYNGKLTDASVGGEGDHMLASGYIELSAGKANEFVIDGNYIHIYQGYADTSSLENAKFTYELTGEGTAEIIKKDNDYYCVITNAQGKAWGYKINLIQKEYQLPIIYIETENHVAITSKETKLPGTFSLDYNETESYTNIDSIDMVIRGRGHSSWKLDKKPYKIKFEDKVSLFGLTAAKEWVLQANHVDKSLIRNKLAMDMGAVLDHVLFVPHSYNVDVFVNGTYMGVYTLTEQIEVKDGRIPGEKDGSAVDTDYLVELGGDEEATSFGTNMFNSPLYNWIEIKNPDTDVLSKEQFDFIKEYIYQADKAAMELDGYEEYIHIPSLIDFFLLTEFSYNVDGAFRRSDFIMKKSDDKLYMATYWDYDYAFGNFWRDSLALDEWICLGNENTKNYITDSWITYLLKDPNFTAQLKARWNEVGEELYRTAMATIDEAEQNVSASAEENFTRWPDVLGHKVQYEHKQTVTISTYEGQLQYLRDFIEKRYKWLDENIKKM